MSNRGGEFAEIGHSGGKITFDIRTEDGRHGYQMSYSGSRPNPMALIAVYALPEGIPVGKIELGGIGQQWNPPPVSGCLPVFIGSDSEGKFGHQCPRCDGYWRSGSWSNVCPYCGTAGRPHDFLSKAQLGYIREYCHVLSAALESGQEGKVTIDMDAVADAAGTEGEKPPFYVSDESQQHKFTCVACNAYNDILGRFGFCSSCGTRVDFTIYKDEIIPAIRARLNADALPEDCLRDGVSAFDSFVGQYAKQLATYIPMKEQRKVRLLKQRFHNLEELRETFKQWFDIDVCAGMKEKEYQFVRKMLHRRHVYEHNGGEVDQKYIDDSGDTSVKPKQHIHETKEETHALLGSLLKMADNIHKGFHQLLPPYDQPIKVFEQEKAWKAKFT